MALNSDYEVAVWHRVVAAAGGVARVAHLTDRCVATVYAWQEGKCLPSVQAVDRLIEAIGFFDDERLLFELRRMRDAAMERWLAKRSEARERFKKRFGVYPSRSKLQPGAPSEPDTVQSVAVIGPLAPRKSGLPMPPGDLKF
jgi:hypothetical protein